jgi:periplasmic protein TonB
MAAVAFDWFEDEGPGDLKRWAIAAAVVIGIHVLAIAGYLYVHQPEEVGDDNAPITVDLSFDQPDVPPPPEVEQKPDEPPPTPPPEEAQTEVTPPPEQMPVEEPKPEPPPPPPPPPRVNPAAVVRAETAYENAIRKHLARYLPSYPSETHPEEGTVHVGFSLSRNGRVLERHIIRSSGHVDLDNAALGMVDRAQPFPAFPAAMPESEKIVEFPLHFGQ